MHEFIRSSLSPIMLRSSALRRMWARYRGRQLEQRYQAQWSHYQSLAEERGLLYTEESAAEAIRMRAAGLNITPKAPGQCHSMIVSLTRNWGIGMVYELEELGPVTVFDWEKYGFREGDLPRVPELNDVLLRTIREVHARQPIDWIFMPVSGYIILATTLRRIREELGIPTVNQWLDCKQNFEAGIKAHGQDVGMVDIAPEFDVIWTSSRAVCEWYMAVGARPVFMPEGFSPRLTPRLKVPAVADVAFLGACYGLRLEYVKALRRAGLKVRAAGYGWPGEKPVALEAMGEFFASCKLNLGMGYMGSSERLTTVKGRDFEVPGAGAAYLTTFNPDLAAFFEVGKEIQCYQTKEEMVELAWQLVRYDAARTEMAERAYQRSMREHRWVHRFRHVLDLLEVQKSRSADFARTQS